MDNYDMVSIPSTQFSLVDITTNNSDLDANTLDANTLDANTLDANTNSKVSTNLSSFMVPVKPTLKNKITQYPIHIQKNYSLKPTYQTNQTNIHSNINSSCNPCLFIQKTVLVVSTLGCIYYFLKRANM